MTEKHFQEWNYSTVQELEQLCLTLPVLSRDKAALFFNAARTATKRKNVQPVERRTGNVFESLKGFVSASDRKDFTAKYELAPENLTHGVLMVETFDETVGCIFCVASSPTR